MIKKLKYPFDIQLFAEGGNEGSDGSAVEGGSEPTAEPKSVSKDQFDKVAKELGELKKKMKDQMTAEEKWKLDLEEKENKIKELERETNKSNLKSNLLGQGYSKKEVDSIAEKIMSGDIEGIAKELGNARKNAVSELEAQIAQLKLDSTPRPDGATDPKPKTLADFAKMTLDERTQLKASDPELYAQLSNK